MQRKHLLLPLSLVVALVASGLRCAALGVRDVHLWEASSVLMASRPVSELWLALSYDVHPPLFFLVARFWLTLFGASPASLRVFGAICSAAVAVTAAAMAWHLAGGGHRRRLLSAAAAGLYTATSPAAVLSIGLFRMYGLLAAASLLLFWHAINTQNRCRGGRLFALVALGSILGYLHYVGMLLCIGLLCSLVATPNSAPRRLALVLRLGCLWAAAFGPWAVTAARQTQAYWSASPTTETFVAIAQSVCYWGTGVAHAPRALAILVAGSGVLGLVAVFGRSGRAVLLLAGACASALLLCGCAFLLQPVMANARFWAPMAILAVVGTSAAAARWSPAAQATWLVALVGAQSISLLFNPPTLDLLSPRCREVLDELQALRGRITLVAPPPEAVMLEYHRRLRAMENVEIWCLTEVELGRHEPQRAALPFARWIRWDELERLPAPIYIARDGRLIVWKANTVRYLPTP